jgi:hypothetical protein
MKIQRDSGNTSTSPIYLSQSVESVNSIPFAGKTVTLSFYAKAGANFSASGSNLSLTFASGTGTDQNFVLAVTGQNNFYNGSVNISTTLQRFTFTGNVPSNATQLGFYIGHTPVGTAGADDSFTIERVQLEVGQTATPFRRNANSIQGELAACQRYYYRQGGASFFQPYGFGASFSTTGAVIAINLLVQMRVPPTSLEFSLIGLQDNLLAGVYPVTTAIISQASPTVVQLDCGVSSGLTALRPTRLLANNSLNSFVGISAEL